MAGTCAIIKDIGPTMFRGMYLQTREIGWRWVADGSGDVSGEGGINITGAIVGARFAPDTGDTQPLDLYDVTVVDGNGVDILMGVGANAPQSLTSTTNYRTPVTSDNGFPYLVDEKITPVVAGAGAANAGYIYITLRV
jgi:hypothetical protein